MENTVTIEQIAYLAASVVRRAEEKKKEKEKNEHAKQCSAHASD